MHTLIVRKSDNVILQSRYDTATEKTHIDEVFANYVEDNNVDAATIEIVEIPFVKFTLTVGKEIYNKATGQIKQNPNWSEPPSESTAGIPTTDSSTGVTVNA